MTKKYITDRIAFKTLGRGVETEKLAEYERRFRRAGVDRIILFFARSFADDERRKKAIENFKVALEYYSSRGFEVMADIATVGYGSTIEQDIPAATREASGKFTRLTDFYGNTQQDAFCLMDPNFQQSICSFLTEIARAGAKMIILDDDLCMNVRPGLGCACDHHMERYRQLLGEPITREELQDKIYVGGPNRYRDAWMQLMGDTLRDFCRKVRAALDAVDSNIRCGQMCSYTNWDLEGADAIEISKILAGKNRPFMRLSGAPYWVSGFQRFHSLGMRMPTIIEFVRAQKAWCAGEDIELMDENDAWPNARQHCPAALMECYDLCLTAEGGIDSYLHMIDAPAETFPPELYTNGFMDAREHDMPLTQWMEQNFSGDAAGVRVYEAMHKVREMRFPEEFIGQQKVMDTAFSPSQSLLANLSIPTALRGCGKVGIAFGVNAKLMTEEERKTNLILDIEAAVELKNLGVDVGLLSRTPAPLPSEERFADGGRNPIYFSAGRYYRMEIDPRAQVQSWFERSDDSYIAAYRYENAQGQRFLVYAFDGYGMREDGDTFISMNRQKQLFESIAWLGYALPVTCECQPGLYILCRRDGDKLCAAVCNTREDWIWSPTLKLDAPYKSFEAINAEGELDGCSLKLRTDIPPFGFIPLIFHA